MEQGHDHGAEESKRSAFELGLHGGGGASPMYKHYRELTTEAEARRYWEILPNAKAEVIEFAKANA